MIKSDGEWWDSHRHHDRRPVLLARNRIQAAIRSFFAAEDFVEVDPACLAVSPGNETHLHAFKTTAIGNDGLGQTRYLHTSPEFAMKKLLAAGEERIHAFSHVWRNRERGPLHAPEFTMLEWYRVGAPYDRLMADTMAIARHAAEQAGASHLSWRGLSCDPFLDPDRISVTDAFARYAGIDLLATIAPDGTTDMPHLAGQMTEKGLRFGADETWSDLFSRVLSEKIEPNLGIGRMTILDEYPAAEAALARKTPGDPRLSERFEVYAATVELANGFGELTDPVEQRRRFVAEMAEKQRRYGETYPIDDDLLSALSHVPPSSGIAMGFDRLVVLATHAPRIDEVLWTPPA